MIKYWIAFLPKNAARVFKIEITGKTYMELVRIQAKNVAVYDANFQEDGLFIDFQELVFWKIYMEQGNPLEHDDHYDDPLN